MISEKEIRFLLDKFYEGSTTLEEEMLIEDYFMSCVNTSQDLKADKELFDVLREQKYEDKINVPDSLIQEISIALDHEILNTTIKKEKWNYKSILSIAASVILVICITIFLEQEYNRDDVCVSSYTVNENIYIPQTEVEAAAEVSRALILVADKLNQANDNVIYTSYNLDESDY